MALSRVQSKSGSVNPGTSVVLSLNSASTSGNLLVLCVSCYYAGVNSGGTWTASDSRGNTWTSAVLTDSVGKMQIFYAENISGGASHTVTLSVAGASTYLIATVIEYSGAATSSSLDRSAAALTATNTTAYSSPTTSTTTDANEVLIGCHHAYQSAATPTPATDWATVATQTGSSFHTHTVQDRIVSATGAYASSGTWSATGANHTDAIVTFKAAATGGYTLAADPGSVTVTGQAATLKVGRVVSAAPGSFTATGTAATLRRGYVLQASSGSVSVSGTAATLRRGYVLPAASGSFVVTGTDATFSTGSKVLSAASGTFTVTGFAATLRRGRVLPAAAGSFTITGTAATFISGKRLTAAPGSFVVTGSNADLRRGLGVTMSASGGSFLVTGTAATLIHTIRRPTGQTYSWLVESATFSDVVSDGVTTSGIGDSVTYSEMTAII